MSRYYMLAIAVMVFFCMKPLLAQETGSFMRNPAEARTMSLAGAGIVSADDVSAFDNAALTPFSRENLSVNASMLMWMPKMYNNQISYSASARYSFRKAGTFYLGAREFKYPSLEQTDDYGNVTGTSRPGDLAVEAGYAYPFLRDFSAALTARYLRLNPGYGSVANAVSFDAGLGFRHYFNATGPLTDVAIMAMGGVLCHAGSMPVLLPGFVFPTCISSVPVHLPIFPPLRVCMVPPSLSVPNTLSAGCCISVAATTWAPAHQGSRAGAPSD